MGRIEQKKADKRKRLLASAYECFSEKGVSDTSIAEICSRSGIAKGTFYLYYNNKDELSDALSKELSEKLCMDAFSYVSEHRETDLCSNVMTLIRYIIQRFRKEDDLLKILHNHFIFPISAEQFIQCDKPQIISFRTDMEHFASKKGISVREQFGMIAALCMMTAEISYSSRMHCLPDSAENMYQTVMQIITDCFQAA